MSNYIQIRNAAVREAITVGVASGPVPGVDMPGMAVVLGRAIYRLSVLHKREIDLETAGKIALSILSATVMYTTSVKVFGWILYLFPMIGIVANSAVSAVIDALIALRMCRFFDKTLASKNFNQSDAGECVYLLIAIPSLSELKELSDVFKVVAA